MNAINTQRVLPLLGGYNFRDLGGLPSKNGKHIKRNLLFRADELGNLRESDLALLADLNVRTVIDFRTKQEREKSVDKVPSTCVKEVHLDIVSANMDTLVAEIQKGNTDFKALMVDFYTDLVLGENAQKQFTAFFEILQQTDNTTAIYHCTAGKDRTGVATALILEGLQVDRKITEEDYLLSNNFLKVKYDQYMQQDPKYADLFMARLEYLQTALAAIEEKYETVENYLTTVLQVDLMRFRSIYLA